tara:strand:- start:482 stop:1210 length:729 start_codon:yes stop_codon:yes gene_type:complete
MPAHIAAVMSPREFHPEDIGWHTLVWAGGTEFLLEGYADNDAITTAPDEFGAAADDLQASPSSSSQKFATGGTAFGGENCIEFDGTGAGLSSGTHAKTWAANAYTAVVVCWPLNTTNAQQIFGDTSGIPRMKIHIIAGSSTLRINGVNAQRAFTLNAANSVCAYIDSAAATDLDVVYLNGLLCGEDEYGANSMTGLEIGGDGSTDPFHGSIAFVGLYNGDLRADAQFADLADWVSDTYGVLL